MFNADRKSLKALRPPVQLAWGIVLIGSMLFGECGANANTIQLTAKMSIFNNLLGKRWTCSNRGAGVASIVTFEAVAGNVLHGHVAGVSWVGSSDDYYGFTQSSQSYWETSADSLGSHTYAVSRKGFAYVGYVWSGVRSRKFQLIMKYSRPANLTVEVGYENGSKYVGAINNCHD